MLGDFAVRGRDGLSALTKGAMLSALTVQMRASGLFAYLVRQNPALAAPVRVHWRYRSNDLRVYELVCCESASMQVVCPASAARGFKLALEKEKGSS